MNQYEASRRRVLKSLAVTGGSMAGLDALAQAASGPRTVPSTPEAQMAAASAAGDNLPGGPDDILIGQSSHYTGPVSATAIMPDMAVNAAISDFNAKGGVGGRNVRLIKLDDAYNPKRCVENVIKLIDEHKVVALYGLASTGNVGAVLPVLMEKKVPLICTYTGSPAVRAKHRPYHFTGTASYKDEVVQMIRNLVTTKRTELGLVYHNSPFGKLMLPVVEEVAKEYGANLVIKQPVDISGKDSDTQVAAMAAAKLQAVLIISFGPSAVNSVRAVRNYIGVPTYVISVGTTGNAVDLLGDDSRGMAVTQILPYPWRQTTPFVREFHASMQKHNVLADYNSMLGYLNIRVLLEGLKRCKPKNVTPAAIVKAMESLGKYDMGGYPLHFSPTQHHGSSFVEITIVGPNKKFMR